MNELISMVHDTVERILGHGVDQSLLDAAETGAWCEDLWRTLVNNGLTAMLGAEDGMGWREAFPVIAAAGRHCLPLPLPESIAGGWLLAQAGLVLPEGRTGISESHDGDLRLRRTAESWRLDGCAARVPWGRNLDHLVLSLSHDREPLVVLAPVIGCTVTAGANLVGEPRDTLAFHDQPVTAAAAPAGVGPDAIRYLGALLRAGQMAGAAAAVLQRSVAYAGERQQFGRAIGRFQAIQHMLAVLAEESAAATTAAEQAFVAMDTGGDAAFAIAVAKLRTGEAAGRVAAIAHQIHGAIGFAREHPLHHSTRRLLAWRAEFGAEAAWAQRIAERVVPLGAAGLWPFMTAAQMGGAAKGNRI